MNCSHCGAQNREDALFCTQCGRPLNSHTCPNCHQEVSEDALYCQYCGQPLTSDEGERCVVCHHLNNPGTRYCVQCGNKLNQAGTEYKIEYVDNGVEEVDKKIHWGKIMKYFLMLLVVTIASYMILRYSDPIHVTGLPKNTTVIK